MKLVIIAAVPIGRHPDDPLPPPVVAEFGELLERLDRGVITRAQWVRFQSILTIATLEANNMDDGVRGYHKALAQWRKSTFFDGKD